MDGNELPTKTSVGSFTRTDPGSLGTKAKKETVSPSFFYRNNRLIIKCIDPRTVYGIAPHENSLGWDIEELDWPVWRDEYRGDQMGDGLAAIAATQRSCKNQCACDSDGKLIPVTGGTRHSCTSERAVARYTLIFGCYCSAILTQPLATVPGATHEDYRNAIERIPQTVRNDNPNFWWRMHGIPDPRRPSENGYIGWGEPARRLMFNPPPWVSPENEDPFRPYESEAPPSPLEPLFFRHGLDPDTLKPWNPKRDLAASTDPNSHIEKSLEGDSDGTHTAKGGENGAVDVKNLNPELQITQPNSHASSTESNGYIKRLPRNTGGKDGNTHNTS
ncbi:hypothetical protein TWF730_002578 [Orbilia blumenaviensis]|uniref:Uncharacterized protein n=1 Tax=Orbilia blumenaviensis TaxID=1796055 RepID=A0AAV9UES3_9PEZI